MAKILDLSLEEKIELYKKAGREELVRIALLEGKLRDSQSHHKQADGERFQFTIQSGTSHLPLHKPSRVPHFVGREEEIDQIITDLQPGRVVTLCGPGGIGKTSIVREVIWRLASDDGPPEGFPDGGIFYNFYDDGRVDLFLEYIADCFDVEPTPTAEAAARRALDGRIVLLVLDGADKADKLEKMFDVAGTCGMLLTSRRREDAPDRRYRHYVSQLSIEDSMKLLLDWSGTRSLEDTIAQQICELLDGVPLAIRLAGSILDTDKIDEIDFLDSLRADLMTALDRGETEHKSIRLLLERSVNGVSETARSVLYAAGSIPTASFTREMLSGSIQISTHQLNLALGELVNHSLLERYGRRYRFVHSLLYTYTEPISQRRKLVREMLLSVVLSCHNEASYLPALTADLFHLPIPDLRLLMVDNNSSDGTGQVAEQLAEQYNTNTPSEQPRLTVLRGAGKGGLGTGYVAGVRRALADGADYIVQMNADFSHDPVHIPQMLGVALAANADLVVVNSGDPGGHLDDVWSWRRPLTWGGRVLLLPHIRVMTAGFKLWRREALLNIGFQNIRSSSYLLFHIRMAYLIKKQGHRIIILPAVHSVDS